MDLELIKEDQKDALEFNPLIANGFSYERMKSAPEYIDAVLKSAFSTLKSIGFTYRGYNIPTVSEGLEALSRSSPRGSKRSLEVTKTSSYPITCKIEFREPSTGATEIFRKDTHVTFLEKGNVFHNKGSKYIVAPKLGDRVFSLDKESIFVAISRSRMVFVRTPYYFNLDGRVISTDIHRAKLYYESGRKAKKTNEKTIPTLVNYMLAECGLTEAYRRFFGVDVLAVHEDDATVERFPLDKYTICKSHGEIKTKTISRTSTALIFRNDQFCPELMHVIAATFFILDKRLDCRDLQIKNLDSKTGWIRALANWALEENDEFAAYEKVESHIESVKSYIDHATRIKFNREGYDIKDTFGLFGYVIRNFAVIASTHNVASLDNKVLSIVPHFLFNLTSSIFRMMFELQKTAAKRELRIAQVRKLIQKTWKEEAAIASVTQADNVRNLDHANDCMVVKATRLMVPQSKPGKGAKKQAEMTNPAFAFHHSKVGLISYQYVNKSCPTGMDSLNPFCVLMPGDVVKPHPAACPIIENMKELTVSKSTL